MIISRYRATDQCCRFLVDNRKGKWHYLRKPALPCFPASSLPSKPVGKGVRLHVHNFQQPVIMYDHKCIASKNDNGVRLQVHYLQKTVPLMYGYYITSKNDNGVRLLVHYPRKPVMVYDCKHTTFENR